MALSLTDINFDDALTLTGDRGAAQAARKKIALEQAAGQPTAVTPAPSVKQAPLLAGMGEAIVNGVQKVFPAQPAVTANSFGVAPVTDRTGAPVANPLTAGVGYTDTALARGKNPSAIEAANRNSPINQSPNDPVGPGFNGIGNAGNARAWESGSGISAGVRFDGAKDATQYTPAAGEGVMTRKNKNGLLDTIAMSSNGRYDPAAEAQTAAASRAAFEKAYADVLPGIRAEMAGKPLQGIAANIPQSSGDEPPAPGSVGYALWKQGQPSRPDYIDNVERELKSQLSTRGGTVNQERNRSQAIQALLSGLNGYENEQSRSRTADQDRSLRRDDMQGRQTLDIARLGNENTRLANDSLRTANDSKLNDARIVHENALTKLSQAQLDSSNQIQNLRTQYASLDDGNDPGGKLRAAMKAKVEIMSGKDGDQYQAITGRDEMGNPTVLGILDRKSGKMTDASGNAVTNAGSSLQSGANAMPSPKSEAEMNALPKGTKYVAPDGSVRIKQ